MSSGQPLRDFTPREYIPATATAAYLSEFANNDPGLLFNASYYKTSFDIPFVPLNYSAAVGLTLEIDWAAVTATSGYVIWQVQFQLVVPGTTPFGTDTPGGSPETVQTNAPTVAGVAVGILTKSLVPLTVAQLPAGLAAGSHARVFVTLRAGSTMAGDLLVGSCVLWDT